MSPPAPASGSAPGTTIFTIRGSMFRSVTTGFGKLRNTTTSPTLSTMQDLQTRTFKNGDGNTLIFVFDQSLMAPSTVGSQGDSRVSIV